MRHLALLALGALLVGASPAPAPAGQSSPSCQIRGYDRGKQAYKYLSKSSLANEAACGAQCKSDSQCRSFAVGAGACLLYSATV